jgi:tripartite-type tricarboxylate transporter receptor subunit TctC
MTMPRVLRISFAWLLACAALLSAPIVQAQAYPNKPIKIIVPYPPGGTSDILARAIGQKLTDSLGQTIVVENKPGANGNLGADFVKRRPMATRYVTISAPRDQPEPVQTLIRPDH